MDFADFLDSLGQGCAGPARRRGRRRLSAYCFQTGPALSPRGWIASATRRSSVSQKTSSAMAVGNFSIHSSMITLSACVAAACAKVSYASSVWANINRWVINDLAQLLVGFHAIGPVLMSQTHYGPAHAAAPCDTPPTNECWPAVELIYLKGRIRTIYFHRSAYKGFMYFMKSPSHASGEACALPHRSV